MRNNEIINFKYRTNSLANIISLISCMVYLIIIYLIFKSTFAILISIILIIFSTIIELVFLTYISKKASVINGQFILSKNELNYTSLNKTYIIKYNEIDYISKESFIDYSNIFNIEKYYYKIKIKNEKSFIFSYYDQTLVYAIEKLSQYSKIKIDDITK